MLSSAVAPVWIDLCLIHSSEYFRFWSVEQASFKHRKIIIPINIICNILQYNFGNQTDFIPDKVFRSNCYKLLFSNPFYQWI